MDIRFSKQLPYAAVYFCLRAVCAQGALSHAMDKAPPKIWMPVVLTVAACDFLFMIHWSFPAENFFGSTAYAVIYLIISHNKGKKGNGMVTVLLFLKKSKEGIPKVVK